MKINTSIRYMDYYIPPRRIAVEEVFNANINNSIIMGKNHEEFFRQFKEESRIDRIAAFEPDHNLAGIISEMMDKLFSTTGVKAAAIKYLVCGNPVIMEDNISIVHYIHKKYNLENATILPVFQPCVSTIIAMGLSEKLLNKNEKEYMLVLSAKRTPDLQSRFVGFSVLGDGLSLVLIENTQGDFNITNWNSLSNGTSSYNKVEDPKKIQSSYQQQMNIIKNGISFLKTKLKEFDTDINGFDKIIQPNTNYSVWHEMYSGLLDIDPDKFYLKNIGNGGHINDVDLVRNMKDYIDNNKADKRNLKLLIYGVDLVNIALDVNYHMVTLDISSSH